MKNEIDTATRFLALFLKKSCVATSTVKKFVQHCQHQLQQRFNMIEWNPDHPQKDARYRVIRVIKPCLDLLIVKAGLACNVSIEKLRKIFNVNFTLWINPYDVCVKLDHDNEIKSLYI